MDYDPLNANDHIDDIYVTITRSPGSSYSSRGSYTGIHGNSRIELSFRVQCGTNYYGSNCATYCVARDDSGGHYTCGTNGQKICRSGWSSSYCTTRKSLSLSLSPPPPRTATVSLIPCRWHNVLVHDLTLTL